MSDSTRTSGRLTDQMYRQLENADDPRVAFEELLDGMMVASEEIDEMPDAAVEKALSDRRRRLSERRWGSRP